MSKKLIVIIVIVSVLLVGAMGYFIYRTVTLGAALRAADAVTTEAPEVEAPVATEEVVEVPVTEIEGESPVDETAVCPTNAEFQATFGLSGVFHGVEWDNCQWQIQAVGLTTYNLSLPENWQATVTLTDGTVALVYGPWDGEVQGSNVRYVPAYTVEHDIHTPCAWLEYENSYSHSVEPPYDTVALGFTCPTP